MLRLTTDQPDFWDYLLPEEAKRMHPELLVVAGPFHSPAW